MMAAGGSPMARAGREGAGAAWGALAGGAKVLEQAIAEAIGR